MSDHKGWKLSVGDDGDVAYLYLPAHPRIEAHGVITKQVRLADILHYSGPDIYLDLDKDGKLLGIEIVD